MHLRPVGSTQVAHFLEGVDELRPPRILVTGVCADVRAGVRTLGQGLVRREGPAAVDELLVVTHVEDARRVVLSFKEGALLGRLLERYLYRFDTASYILHFKADWN